MSGPAAGAHVLTVVGARPQFVKVAPTSAALQAAGVRETLVHTGQHHDEAMSGSFFDELGLPLPHHWLDVHGGGHGRMTGRMLEALEPVLEQEQPDAVLVYGDTNSTLAGALAAAKLVIPVLHMEAGLRSYRRSMPEEVNRVLTDHLSSLLLCPTPEAVRNLAAEGITEGVRHVGDVMYDAALRAAQRCDPAAVLLRHGVTAGDYAVATVHRAENVDEPAALHRVVAYLEERALELPVLLPLHPRTREAMARAGLVFDAVRVLPALGHGDMTALVSRSARVYTDSGGLQKEAYFHGVPCVTLRDETEWVETVAHGWNRLWSEADYRVPRTPIEDYGDGRAAAAAVAAIVDFLAHG